MTEFTSTFTCAGVIAPGAALLYEALTLSRGAVWSALWWLAWGAAALHFIMTVGVWAATLRTLGVSCLCDCPRILRLSMRATPVREVVVVSLLPLAAASLAGLFGIGREIIAELPVGAVLLIALLYFTQLLVPPVALIFASSTDEQLRWVLGLKKFTAGRRVVSLLDTGYMTVRPTAGDLAAATIRRSGSLTDVLRVSDSANWRDGVEELIDISPIVILDTRVCTEALLFEASLVLTPQYAYKAVFVSDDKGVCPVLERLLDEGRLPPGHAVNAVTEGELGQLLRTLVASPHALPRPDRCIAKPLTIGGRQGTTDGRPVLKRQAPSPVPDGSAEGHGQLQTGGRRTLSTPLTPFWRALALAVILNVIASSVLTISTASLQRPFYGTSSVTVWALLGLNWSSSSLYLYLAYSLKKVSISGDTLFVSNYRKEIVIQVSQISRVSGPDWTGLRRITLQLHQSSAFGRKIIFAGRFLSAGKIARELRGRLYAVGMEPGRTESPQASRTHAGAGNVARGGHP